MNARNIIWLVAAGLLGAGVAALLFLGGDEAPDAGPPDLGQVTAERGARAGMAHEVDEPAPDFELPMLDGGTFRLADHEGEVVVVNFWATWCAPCRIEIPDLIEMQSELGDQGVRFVGISLDDDGREVVSAFAEDAGFNYPIVLDDGAVAEKFGGIYALPTTIVIDREGIVRRRISGLVTKRMLTPILQELAGA